MPGEDIYSWSTTAVSNGSADTSINWLEGQARASVNNSSRAEMAAHAKNRDLQTGTIVTTGNNNAQAFISGVGYTAVPTGMRVLLKIGFTNTGSTTLNMDAIGPVTIKDQFGDDLVGGELVANTRAEFLYNGTNWIALYKVPFVTDAAHFILRNYIDGLTLSYDTTSSISVAVGLATDSTNAVLLKLENTIIKTTSNWAVGTSNGGLDAGTIAASTWYHVHLIRRSDTGAVDVLFSLSATAPTLPTAYDRYRRIGSCLTNAASQFLPFTQNGDNFIWKDPVTNMTAGAWTTTAKDVVMSVPPGVIVEVIGMYTASAQSGVIQNFAIYPKFLNDFIVTTTGIGTGFAMGQASFNVFGCSDDVRCLTDTAAQVRIRSSDPVGIGSVATYGWNDPRGKNS